MHRNFTLKPFCSEGLGYQLLGPKALVESDRIGRSLPCLQSQQMIWGGLGLSVQCSSS